MGSFLLLPSEDAEVEEGDCCKSRSCCCCCCWWSLDLLAWAAFLLASLCCLL